MTKQKNMSLCACPRKFFLIIPRLKQELSKNMFPGFQWFQEPSYIMLIFTLYNNK